MYDIIAVGSSTLDVFAKARFSELIKIKEPKGETELLAFPSGSKILIDDLEFTLGGGGTNTAFAFAKLGLKTAYLGKLGNDIISKMIENYLCKEKIQHICVHGKDKSGYSLILDTLEHDRTILTYKGANDTLSYREIPIRKIKTKWFYFCAMVNESFKTLEKLAVFAEKNKIKFAFNPSSYLAEKGANYLKQILCRSNVLVLNKEEAMLIAGNTSNEMSAKNLLLKLRSIGPDIVVITDGKNKIYAIDSKCIYECKPPRARIVDRTGAGDAFGSSFTAGLIKDKTVEFSIKLGIANATSVLSQYGAKNGLLGYKEAVSLMKKLRVKVRKRGYRGAVQIS